MSESVPKLAHRPSLACTWAAVILLLLAFAGACSDTTGSNNTPGPAPTFTPEPTPTPTATPVPADSLEIAFWELDASSTGRDLIALLTPEEAACLGSRLGARFQEVLTTPLSEGDLLERDGSVSSPVVDCLTRENLAAAMISMLSMGVGGLSAETQDCMTVLLKEDPAMAEALAQTGESEGGPTMLRLIACLRPGEAAALTAPGEDPPPNPADIACLVRELEGSAPGDRIIAVLSGMDPSGEGLTMQESAMLGEAVEACGIVTEFDFPSAGDMPGPPPDETRSDRVRAAPSAGSGDVAALVDGNSAFAFDLYQALRTQEGNLFYSPHSISLALAMTYAGAGGRTESQMADTLRFSLSQDRLHPAFNSLDQELASRGTDVQGRNGEGFRLNIVNAVWGQQGHPFRAAFLDVLAESYGAGVRPTDFVAAPEESRLAINDWVAESTEDRIRDLIPQGIINPLTRMVLTNAIYFNASWLLPFSEANTGEHPFHLLDGSSVDVPMMRTEEEFRHAAGDGYQAVDLPYVGHELSMTVIVPDRGRFREFEDSLDAALVDRIITGLAFRYVALDLPRFELESQFRLGETLGSMGMTDAFDSAASDLSGMDGRSCLAGDAECLYIREVVHKAFVSVDEAGTEAAAATAVVVQTESAKPTPIGVTVDRPFIFLIRDRETEAVLFVGRVEAISPAPAAEAQPFKTAEPGDADSVPRLGTDAPGEGRESPDEATAPGAPEPAPDDATVSQSELGPLGRLQQARQLTGPVLYVDAELETPTVTAEVDGSSILFTAEDARGYNRTVVELEGIGLWEAVTPEEEVYIDLFVVPAPTLETVRWRVAAAIAPEEAGGRYRIGPWTDWSVLQVPQVAPPDAGVDRS